MCHFSINCARRFYTMIWPSSFAFVSFFWIAMLIRWRSHNTFVWLSLAFMPLLLCGAGCFIFPLPHLLSFHFISEGYFDVCCIKAGTCGEASCPELCLFCESCVCNCIAVSASRTYVMEKYDLSSDECDYRLIRINNCLQGLACFCAILAFFMSEFQQCSR